MAGYGGFLFVFTLHLQAGLGQSALRAGLSYIPLAGMFGLVATAAQLSQVIGVAGFGSVYLSLAQRAGPHAVASGNALASTATLLALLAGIGLVPAVALARAVVRTGRPGR